MTCEEHDWHCRESVDYYGTKFSYYFCFSCRKTRVEIEENWFKIIFDACPWFYPVLLLLALLSIYLISH